MRALRVDRKQDIYWSNTQPLNPPHRSGNIRSIDAKGFKGIKPWPEVIKAQRAAASLVAGRSKDLLVGVKPGNEQAAQAALKALQVSIDELGAAADVQDRFAAVTAQIGALKSLDRLGTLEVAAFPYAPTGDYKEIPRLLGRAEVELTIKSARTGRTGQLNAILDGFSAPLTAGHFTDLVAKGALDKVEVTNTDESSVSFAANGAGACIWMDGWICACVVDWVAHHVGQSYLHAHNTGKAPARKLPLEILVAGDKVGKPGREEYSHWVLYCSYVHPFPVIQEPSYGETLEEQGLYKATPVLPFSACKSLPFFVSMSDLGPLSPTDKCALSPSSNALLRRDAGFAAPARRPQRRGHRGVLSEGRPKLHPGGAQHIGRLLCSLWVCGSGPGHSGRAGEGGCHRKRKGGVRVGVPEAAVASRPRRAASTSQ